MERFLYVQYCAYCMITFRLKNHLVRVGTYCVFPYLVLLPQTLLENVPVFCQMYPVISNLEMLRHCFEQCSVTWQSSLTFISPSCLANTIHSKP